VRAFEAFDGVWERMKRAKAHREAAAKAWSTWLTDYEPYGEWLYIDDDGIGTLSIRQFSPPPAGIAIELGEWLYNLRAALDYTAFALAIHNTHRDPPPRDWEIQFPICESEASFRKNQYRIASLAQQHREWIEAMQPYANGSVPAHTAIYWVNHLSRLDRHRQLQVVGGHVAESDPIVALDGEGALLFETVDPFVFIETGADGEGEAVVARFKVVPASSRDRVSANPQTAIDPDVLEMVRERTPDVPWLYFPLSKRLRVIEAMIDANIGLFENDVVGWTRARYFKKPGGVEADPETIDG
jgi:hypothetical protein